MVKLKTTQSRWGNGIYKHIGDKYEDIHTFCCIQMDMCNNIINIMQAKPSSFTRSGAGLPRGDVIIKKNHWYQQKNH